MRARLKEVRPAVYRGQEQVIGRPVTGRAVTAEPPPNEEPVGLQAPKTPVSPDPGWDFYWPTSTRTPPGRKYSQMARYSARYQLMEIIFRDGTPWHYDNVSEDGWNFFKRSLSTWDWLRRDDQFGQGAPGGWGFIGVGQRRA
jgi:hypothetical protein